MHLYAWRGSSKGDDKEIAPFLASKSYQNINFDQIKNRDINLMIIYLIFYLKKCNFLSTHVDARSRNSDFFTIFGRKQPMRRELANSSLKAKIEIEHIGGFTKSLSEYGRVWTWIAYFLKLIPNTNLKNIDLNFFWKFDFFPINPHRPFACVVRQQQRRQSWNSPFLASKSYQNINFDQIKTGT